MYRSVGWVLWHATACALISGVAAAYASEVSGRLAAGCAVAGAAAALRALTMRVTVTDDVVRVRNLFRTATIPVRSVREVEIAGTRLVSLSWDQLTFTSAGGRVGASSCCQAWWWKAPSLRLRDAVRVDVERRGRGGGTPH